MRKRCQAVQFCACKCCECWVKVRLACRKWQRLLGRRGWLVPEGTRRCVQFVVNEAMCA